MIGLRHISSRMSSRQIPELLQAIFVGELLAPSDVLWIESPWISDIPVIDNRTDRFMTLAPQFNRGWWRLSQVVAHLVERGTVVHLATRPDDLNAAFLTALASAVPAGHPGLRLHQDQSLHAKGILGEGYYLAGSMNLTHLGTTLNDEKVTFLNDPVVIAEQRFEFQARWGGA